MTESRFVGRWFICFKVDMNPLWATTWESLHGKEFDRLKIKPNGWRGSHIVNTYLSPWSLNTFISGFHKMLNFLTNVYAGIFGCQVNNLWCWSQRKVPTWTWGRRFREGFLKEEGSGMTRNSHIVEDMVGEMFLTEGYLLWKRQLIAHVELFSI